MPHCLRLFAAILGHHRNYDFFFCDCFEMKWNDTIRNDDYTFESPSTMQHHHPVWCRDQWCRNQWCLRWVVETLQWEFLWNVHEKYFHHHFKELLVWGWGYWSLVLKGHLEYRQRTQMKISLRNVIMYWCVQLDEYWMTCPMKCIHQMLCVGLPLDFLK